MLGHNTERRAGTDWRLLILLLPGLLSALMLGARRYDLETRDKSVELVLDYSELQSLSVSSGTPIPALLKNFKDAGITGVAITEDLMGDLTASGQITYEQRSSEVGPLTVIRTSDRALAGRVLQSLNARLSPDMISPHVSQGLALKMKLPDAFVVRAAPLTLNLIGLGLSPDAVQLVKSAGLDPVARLQNHPALTEKAVNAAVSDMKRDGIARLICAGEEAFGFRGLIPYSAKQIKDAGLIYGSVEFAKQKGDARMCSELKSQFIRVHSISNAEMAALTPQTAAERYARAVKERGIRLCYVRLPETSGESPVENGTAFVSAIRDQVQAAGYGMGVAQPFGDIQRPKRFLALIALSVVAGGVMLLESLVSLSSIVKYGLLIVGFVLAAGMAMIGETGCQLLALKSAFIFPTLGITALIGPLFNREKIEKEPLAKAVALFVGASALSLCGAILIVGLLADRSYMVKVEQFVGIKAAHLLPILAVIFMMVSGLPIFGKPFSKVRKEISGNIRLIMANPLFIWQAFAIMIALGIIGFALLRTSNDSGVAVSGMEMKFRSILDQLMVVRPRTKEFLIGHPALLLGIAMLLTRRRAWGLPLVALGVLGQVSLVNTFCHIHTPLQVTILREANGLVLGLLIGIAAWYLFVRPRKT